MVAIVKKSLIRTVSEFHQLPDEIVSALECQAEQIKIFKEEFLLMSPAPTKRAKALQNIALIAERLEDAIRSIPFEDRIVLDDEFFGCKNPDFVAAYNFIGNAQAVDLARIIGPGIQCAAHKVQAKLGAIGIERIPKLIEPQAEFISCIAQELKQMNIKPAKSGKFEEICSAVFEEAGLIFPERSLVFFLKNIRPALKSQEKCL